jgi:N-acetylmuramoyl-L-alanine amidase
MATQPLAKTAARLEPLPYEERLASRSIDTIDLVVIHCTELPDLATAREYGERIQHSESQTGNSGHYYIDRDGSIHVWVRPERVAHHVRNYNLHSVGIELVNTGRYPDWLDSRKQTMSEPYAEAQISSLIGLLTILHAQFPNLRWIAGHEDLDTALVPASDDTQKEVPRKRDPGPMFPWTRVLVAIPLLRMGVQPQR